MIISHYLLKEGKKKKKKRMTNNIAALDCVFMKPLNQRAGDTVVLNSISNLLTIKLNSDSIVKLLKLFACL